jgi:hypothetical protein
MSPVVQRLTQFIQSKGLTNAAFERATGLSNGTIHKAIKFEQALSLSTITAISAAFPDLSIEWLINNTGSMNSRAVNEPIAEYPTSGSSNHGIIIPDFGVVSSYERMASDNMCPVIAASSILACRRIEISRIIYGGVHRIDVRGVGAIVGRITRRDDTSIELHSANSSYPPVVIELRAIITIARVVGGVFYL